MTISPGSPTPTTLGAAKLLPVWERAGVRGIKISPASANSPPGTRSAITATSSLPVGTLAQPRSRMTASPSKRRCPALPPSCAGRWRSPPNLTSSSGPTWRTLAMVDKPARFDFTTLVAAIRQVDEHMAAQAGRAVNISLTLRNWAIGHYIYEYEQKGSDRAQYGERLLERLAEQLRKSGLSRVESRELRRYRQF